MSEIIDLYNKDRTKTRKTTERGKAIPKGLYRLVVHAAIFNNEGKMLIQKRAKEKSLWPDLWDISVGGSCIHGESSSYGMQREIKEELGIDIDLKDVRPSFTFNFDNGFDDIYLIQKDIKLEDCILQKEEVSEIKYATYEEFIELMNQGKAITYYPSYIKLLFETYQSKNIYIE